MRKRCASLVSLAAAVVVCSWAATFAACGTRTGLLVDAVLDSDASLVQADSARDAALEVKTEAQEARDAASEDAPLPPLDAHKDTSKPPVGCEDAGDTQVYLITSQGELLSFYPPTLAFKTVGLIACPNAYGATPFSMAVERTGTAYSVFDNGSLFRLSTANAHCDSTPFVPNQHDFLVFGMGYAGDEFSETLYVSDHAGKGLANIDTKSFALSFLGSYSPPLPKRCEMTGTGDGRLYVYCLQDPLGGVVAEIDRKNANVIAADEVLVGAQDQAFAFAYWGGDFYMFNSDGPTDVTRYDPVLKTETIVASHPSRIVGAGVSTCAP